MFLGKLGIEGRGPGREGVFLPVAGGGGHLDLLLGS